MPAWTLSHDSGRLLSQACESQLCTTAPQSTAPCIRLMLSLCLDCFHSCSYMKDLVIIKLLLRKPSSGTLLPIASTRRRSLWHRVSTTIEFKSQFIKLMLSLRHIKSWHCLVSSGPMLATSGNFVISQSMLYWQGAWL